MGIKSLFDTMNLLSNAVKQIDGQILAKKNEVVSKYEKALEPYDIEINVHQGVVRLYKENTPVEMLQPFLQD